MRKSSYTPLRSSTSHTSRYTAKPWPWWNRMTVRGTVTKAGS